MNENTQEQDKREAVLGSFALAGIGKQYWDQKLSLATFGAGGLSLADSIKSGDMVASLAAGIGLFLSGEKQAIAAAHLVSRALILRGLPLRVMSLPHFRRVICDIEFAEECMNLRRMQAVVVTGFFDKGFESPIPEEDRYVMDWEMKSLMMNNVPLILQSSDPLKTCGWWSRSLLETLADRTVEVGVGK